MCGINGVFYENSIGDSEKLIANMNAKLQHRGPDDSGVFASDNIALGHQRLSIIDLSKDGHQPFYSEDRRFIIVYNGELYNYKKVKNQIKSYSFKTNTDTEVVLAAYIELGEGCLQKFNGMFAFAIWDSEKKELFIARDRLGIKPLYYYKDDENLVFSSEIRALASSGVFKPILNKNVLGEFLQYQTVHAPNTILQDVKMLMPGTFLRISNEGCKEKKYWNPLLVNEQLKPGIKERVKDLFYQSVERRLVADVPFGAFLSGGIDSSIIVGAMSEVSTKKIDTFSITFKEKEFSEGKYARLISKRFNTNHHEIELEPNDFLEALPDALTAMDHPSGDGPNTYLVSKKTKNAGITMALSGLGGDELFGGYSIFKQAVSLQSKAYINALPRSLRSISGGIIEKLKGGVAGQKMNEILSKKNVNALSIYSTFRKAVSDNQLKKLLPNDLILENVVDEIVSPFEVLGNDMVLSQISLAEINTYMQNTLLRDSDQMSMASALEVRVPFLDHELVEYCLSIPDNVKYPHTPKQLLVESMNGLIPNEIVDRPKMGFVFPWKDWMKNELKSFCEERVENIERRELFNNGSIKELWSKFLNNDPLVTWTRVWPIIVLENWMQQNNIEN